MSLSKLLILNEKSDTVDTPPIGKIHLWLTSGGSIKYKDSTGTEFTLAVGVSPEDVQDIVGAFISAQNNKVSVTYNDSLNTLVIGINEGNIVHQNLSGAGTNTHAQIDSHISNTSNPHNTSAAQVGAYTTAQTDSLLSQKYDASNPNGYETPSQLNSRDTANRSRANHTGSQLASTISDFASAVLAIILTGFAVGANTAILATDTILQAFGKIQGQLNQIFSVLSTLVIGDQFEEFSDLTTFTTTANTNQVAASFATASKQLGKYRIGIQWEWTISSNTSDAIFSIWLDGVQISQEFRMEVSEVAIQNIPFDWFSYQTFSSINTHTLELRARAENAGVTVTVSQVRAEIWRASV